MIDRKEGMPTDMYDKVLIYGQFETFSWKFDGAATKTPGKSELLLFGIYGRPVFTYPF